LPYYSVHYFDDIPVTAYCWRVKALTVFMCSGSLLRIEIDFKVQNMV